GDSRHTTGNPPLFQLHGDSPRSVPSPMMPEDVDDLRNQFSIHGGPARLFFAPPGVEPRPADLQRVAHGRGRIALTEHQLIDPRVHVAYPSRPKMTSAFFRMSRSRSTRRSSASNSRTRPSRHAAAEPPRRIN